MSDEQQLLPTPSKEARQWAMFCHLSALLGIWIPFGTLIGPLILWQIKREMDPFIDAQGKEALNFQITVSIAMIIGYILTGIFLGGIVLALVGLANVVLSVMGALAENQGGQFKYPFSIKVVK